MTTFLFANVIASGIKILLMGDPLTRRSRFILACSLALAVGVELVPTWATNTLWPITPGMNPGVRGIRDAIILIMSTSFTFGAIVSFILNLIIPQDLAVNTLHAELSDSDLGSKSQVVRVSPRNAVAPYSPSSSSMDRDDDAVAGKV